MPGGSGTPSDSRHKSGPGPELVELSDLEKSHNGQHAGDLGEGVDHNR